MNKALAPLNLWFRYSSRGTIYSVYVGNNSTKVLRQTKVQRLTDRQNVLRSYSCVIGDIRVETWPDGSNKPSHKWLAWWAQWFNWVSDMGWLHTFVMNRWVVFDEVVSLIISTLVPIYFKLCVFDFCFIKWYFMSHDLEYFCGWWTWGSL